MQDAKDPQRVRLGRLGALTVHARGRTNVTPARAAFLAGIAAEFGITDDLEAAERDRRMDAALRVRMTRLARARWGTKKTGPDRDSGPALEVRRAVGERPPAA